MANTVLDATGVRCPEPVLKIAAKSAELAPGDTLEVLGDCPTFDGLGSQPRRILGTAAA